jgi:PPM family protein phosphatase
VTTPPPIEYALRSDAGRDPAKQTNEDAGAVVASALGWLAVVCDGMGGHAGGREASHAAVAAVTHGIASAGPHASPRSVLRDAIVAANSRVRALGEQHRHGRPGSTVVAALIHAGGAEIAHVGDSRLYWVHDADIVAVTRDHSAVRALVDAGVLTPEQARSHPEANKITRALGIHDTVDVETIDVALAYAAGDYLILGSDGLSDLVEPDEMLAIVTSAPVAQAAGKLVDLANARGGHDNITALVIRFSTTAAALRGNVVTQVLARATVTGLPAQPLVDAGRGVTEVWPVGAVAGGAHPDSRPELPPLSRRGATQLLHPHPGREEHMQPARMLPIVAVNAGLAVEVAASALQAPPAAKSGRLPAGATELIDALPVPQLPLPSASYPARGDGAESLDGQENPRTRRAPWLLLLALFLALVATSALGYLAFREFGERGGKHQP